jgi:hypothetical protein
MESSLWFCAARAEDVIEPSKERAGYDFFTNGKAVYRGPSWSPETFTKVPHLSVDVLRPVSIAALFGLPRLDCIEVTRVVEGSEPLRKLMDEDVTEIDGEAAPEYGASLWTIPSAAAVALLSLPFDEQVAAWEASLEELADRAEEAIWHLLGEPTKGWTPEQQVVAAFRVLAAQASASGGVLFGLYKAR